MVQKNGHVFLCKHHAMSQLVNVQAPKSGPVQMGGRTENRWSGPVLSDKTDGRTDINEPEMMNRFVFI